MSNNVEKILRTFTVIFHLVMIAIVIFVYKSQSQYLTNVNLTASVVVSSKTAFALTNPPPTYTFTPELPPTSTSLPTATLLPTATPIACFSTSLASGTVYLQPSKGRTIGSIPTLGVLLPLYYHLKDENWWLTSIRNSQGEMITGWVSKDSLENTDQCAGLSEIELNSLLLNSKDVYLVESFSSFDNDWLNNNKESSNRSTNNGLTSLYIRSGNGKPVFSYVNNLDIKTPLVLMANVFRNNFSPNSYVGFRLVSSQNINQFIEFRVDAAGDCNVTWVSHEKEYPSIPLGADATCGNDGIEDFILLETSIVEGGIQVSGYYNNILFPPIKVNGDFNATQLNIIVYDGEMEIGYIVIGNNP